MEGGLQIYVGQAVAGGLHLGGIILGESGKAMVD